MSKADGMFEKLGYEKTRDGVDCWCNYENKVHKISFEKNVQSIFFEDKEDNIVLIKKRSITSNKRKMQRIGVVR